MSGWEGTHTSGAGLEARWPRTCDSAVSPCKPGTGGLVGMGSAVRGRQGPREREHTRLQGTQKGKQVFPRS